MIVKVILINQMKKEMLNISMKVKKSQRKKKMIGIS